MFDQGLRSPNRSQDTVQSTLKQQVYQNKLLTSDNKIKTQQLDILKDKVREQEDANTLYKKQIYSMEEKLKYYDEELKLKAQSSEEKTNSLAQNNYNLNKKIQQLQAIVTELEDKLRNSELECSRNAKETSLVRKRLVEAEDQLDKAKDKKRQTVGEIERLSEAHKHVTAENHDLSANVTQLAQENRKILKVIEENEVQIKKLSCVQQEYQELRLKYEDQEAELKALKHSYEVLKKKYDEVYYNYNVGLLAKRDEGSNSEKANIRIAELEQDLVALTTEIARKDKEIVNLKDYLREQDHQSKGQDIKFETEIKRVMNLIDGQTTSCEFLDQVESVAIRLLVENIIKQNREVVWFTDKMKSSAQEIKELKLSVTKLGEEKNVLRSSHEELVKENNLLKNKIQHTVNDSVQNINIVQSNFEERFREVTAAKNDIEERLTSQLSQKEQDVTYLQEILDATRDKLRKVEEDRDHTLEFLREQEIEVKEFKTKFFHIAEETDYQKSKLNTTPYVIASLLKVLFNLISKFDGLVHQKSFLSPYFNQYEKVKKKLAEMQLLGPKTEGDRKRQRIYKRFKRTTLAIIAALRLRKLQLKHSGNYCDTFDVRLNLPDCSEGLKRFFIDLFKTGKFVIQRELVSQVGDILKEVNQHSEDAIASKLISAASAFNKIEYEPKIGKRRHIKELHLEDLTSNFRLRDDFNQKLFALDGKLKAAEEYMRSQEEKFVSETGRLNKKLEEVSQEKETCLKEKERLQADQELAKEQIDLLLTLVDENQSILPATERRNRSLNEDYAILYDYVMATSKKFQNIRKELEEKNIKMIDLERQTIYATYPDNNFVHSTPHASSEKIMKVPGRIFSSARKKNLTDY